MKFYKCVYGYNDGYEHSTYDEMYYKFQDEADVFVSKYKAAIFTEIQEAKRYSTQLFDGDWEISNTGGYTKIWHSNIEDTFIEIVEIEI